MKKTTLIGIFVLLTATAAAAQTNVPVSCNQVAGIVPNPTYVTFTASPDHANVTDYKIGVFLDGVNPNAVPAPMPVTSITVAKADLKIGIEPGCLYVVPDPSALLLAMPIAAVVPYRAAVKAIRSTDSTEADWSDVSNPFVKSGPKPGPASAPKVRR